MKINAFLLILTTFLAAGPAAWAETPCKRPLIVGYEDYPPYMMEIAKGSVGGIDGDVLSALATETGCVFEFVPRPWKRHLAELRDGLVDIASSAKYTAEREVFSHYSRPYRYSRDVLLIRAEDSRNYESLTDFLDRGLRLGIVLGYNYGKAAAILETPGYAGQLDAARSFDLNLKKLVNKRLDGAMGEYYAMLYAAREAGIRQRMKVAANLSRTPIHFIYSKKSMPPSVVTHIDRALQTLEESGRLQAMLEQYTRPAS